MRDNPLLDRNQGIASLRPPPRPAETLLDNTGVAHAIRLRPVISAGTGSFHQLEQRRRDVGQAAAVAQFGLAGGKPLAHHEPPPPD